MLKPFYGWGNRTVNQFIHSAHISSAQRAASLLPKCYILRTGLSSSCCLVSATWLSLSCAHFCRKQMGWTVQWEKGRWTRVLSQECQLEEGKGSSMLQLTMAVCWHFLWQQCRRGENQICSGTWPSWDMEVALGARAQGMSNTQLPRHTGPYRVQPHTLSSRLTLELLCPHCSFSSWRCCWMTLEGDSKEKKKWQWSINVNDTS